MNPKGFNVCYWFQKKLCYPTWIDNDECENATEKDVENVAGMSETHNVAEFQIVQRYFTTGLLVLKQNWYQPSIESHCFVRGLCSQQVLPAK